jgi:hypothetical protein
MTARYVCSFMNPKTGERRQVMVSLDELDTDDEACVEHYRASDGDDHASFIEKVIALRRAYSKVPKGFLHDREPQRRYLQ